MNTGETEKTLAAWNERVGQFAQGVSKNLEQVNEVLKPIVGDPSDDALKILGDREAVPDTDLIEAFKSLVIPSGVLKTHLAKLRGPVAIATGERVAGTVYDNILPSVPEDQSFLELLKVGGVLKVGTTEVLSAIRAAIANRLGLYDLPNILKEKMEKFAEEQDEPVGEEFFKLRRLIVSRNYADVLSVMGVEGSFMSEARKKSFLQKLDQNMWGALDGFHKQLVGWYEAWTAGAANPAAMMTILLMGQTGKSGVVMPPNMMTPPETAGLHDEAEAVINSINKVFSGVGIPVARALAYDATCIKGVLENVALPAAVGATSREAMLKMLKLGVGADYTRLERNITRFTLAIMEFPKITTPNEEYAYLGAMIQLGATIPWDKVTSKAGIGAQL